MNVLVIPEDFRKDQYMLKPIITAMIKAVKKRSGSIKVRICQNPLLGGISEALKWENIETIINQYPMVDLFLLCVDRDGKEGHKVALDKIEKQATEILGDRQLFLAENAWQEIEVWVLAGLKDLPREYNWQEIRQEINPKEIYFLPLLQQKKLLDSVGEGRKELAKEAAQQYDRIRQLCSEDIGNLESRIKGLLIGNDF
ncbi:MAG: hypothetical protein F6K23_10195 [Okeania sp. SIO2C9]|uniref:hypothetical protein n=1 Tax=Okeania sp. SIO2C9 TaxID=2607791 RepID=UPI0013C1AAD8|nr:hypothetical protein [Okeania sp. SIO2C9]NEQ73407.1 hypothetical protein [Okeania sp. SIO2C9]